MSALDDKTKAERALKDIQRTQGEHQVPFGFHKKKAVLLLIVAFYAHYFMFTIYFGFLSSECFPPLAIICLRWPAWYV